MDFTTLKEHTARYMLAASKQNPLPEVDVEWLVNQALREFYADAECVTGEATFLTVINQAEYTLAKPHFSTVGHAWYDTGTSARPLDKTSLGDLAVYDSIWNMRSSGTPTHFLVVEQNVIRLWPKPDAANVTVTVRGIRGGSDLAAASDEPRFHERFHLAVAQRGAVIYAETFAENEFDTVLIERYQNYYEKQAAKCRNQMASEQNQSFQRVVRRRPQRRIPNS